jgi:hypothetical protein
VAGQQPLQRRHVPAAGAGRQDPAAQPRPPAPAERAARRRAGHPVDREPAAGLEAAHRRAGLRPAHAVDRPAVEPLGAQGDLERGDVGALRPGHGGREDHRGERGTHETESDDPTGIRRRGRRAC